MFHELHAANHVPVAAILEPLHGIVWKQPIHNRAPTGILFVLIDIWRSILQRVYFQLFQMMSTSIGVVDPKSFVNFLWQSLPKYIPFEQNDAHEFFIDVLNEIKTVSCFEGRLAQVFTCTSCKKEKQGREEAFCDVSLPFEKKLTKCLEKHNQEFIVPDWNCPSCNRICDASVKTKMTAIPDVVCLQINRWNQHL